MGNFLSAGSFSCCLSSPRKQSDVGEGLQIILMNTVALAQQHAWGWGYIQFIIIHMSINFAATLDASNRTLGILLLLLRTFAANV